MEYTFLMNYQDGLFCTVFICWDNFCKEFRLALELCTQESRIAFTEVFMTYFVILNQPQDEVLKGRIILGFCYCFVLETNGIEV